MVNHKIEKLLVIMGFTKVNELPTMKTLRQTFIKLAVERHPDKGGSDEKFKELYEAYEILGKLIDSQTSAEQDKEETEARRMFREEIWEEINTASITLKVNAAEGKMWEDVLKEHYGEPVKNSPIEKENKGEKYSTKFSHEGEECVMFITIYNPAKKENNSYTG